MKSHNFNNPKPGSLILLGLLLFSVPCTTNAQITISGAVFGGGKQGKVGTALLASGDAVSGDAPRDYVASGDATQVTVKGGTITGNIYGGGEEGNTIGQTNVTLQGGTFTTTSVFGGARMANVNGATHVLIDGQNIKTDMEILNVYGGNDISGNISGVANVVSTKEATETKTIYVHNLYGGGNGDYDYTASGDAAYNKSAPTLAKASIDLGSGCYDQVFGGGNKATVATETKIKLDNKYALQTDGKFANGDVNQFKRVFGGNNKVAMAIQPTWTLTEASITDLYSGGNKGAMTYPQGIRLTVSSPLMTITNMYGGCRMADVNPGETAPTDGYGTYVTVTGGKITNVYGGNDISGDVYYGTKLDILSSIIGDVYGGGNGSYAYTDKITDSDYYYDPSTASTSVAALNLFRPNAAKVKMHIAGTSAENPTYVGGSVYCGGNSATLRAIGGTLEDSQALFQIGSYAILNNVFLGSNGENMINEDILKEYAKESYSNLDLTDQDTFDEYMQGVEVAIRPTVEFESEEKGFEHDYVDYSTNIGSLYCGGNVGSMSASGTFDIDFLEKLVIFTKLVGGCNNANVASGDYNAPHEGGLITPADTKVHLLISGLQIEPKELTYADGTYTFDWRKDSDGNFLGGNIYGGCYQSGYIAGDVVIDIQKDALDNAAKENNLAHNTLFADLKNVFSTALSAFGGGYGEDSEVRGNTTINISKDPESNATGNIIKVFGGGEMGVVSGDATIYLTAGSVGKIYGGGFEGPVKGNTAVYLDGGTVYDAFGGACNADIDGYAKMLIGTRYDVTNALTTVEHNIYGANDFGGTIKTAQTNVASINGTDKNVKSNTYVKYLRGSVAGDIYGGSCGSYDYGAKPYSDKVYNGFPYPQFTASVTGGDINANSFVDIANASTDNNEKIAGSVYGGGRGFLNLDGIVDMNSTYVLLHGSNSKDRGTALVNNVFGGGYYSKVGTTTVDAITGYYNTIYGGTYGATAETEGFNKNYSCTTTNVTTYPTLTRNANLVIFGGGSYAGAGTTNVTLKGGNMAYVYGGSYNEGYCGTTNVSVPAQSNATITGLYGGGYGSNNDKPCDVGLANVTFASNAAYVADAIYGGNRSYRATKSAVINISAPVLTEENSGNYASVYGGGHGINTISGSTKVNLLSGARVEEAYGGGRDGQVLNSYNHLGSSVTSYYPSYSNYANWTGNNDLTYTVGSFKLTKTEGTLRGKWDTPETVNGLTFIDIQEGATVNENVYGGGYGSQAKVVGSPYVKLNGGTVKGNIYGGGYSGPVEGTNITAYCQIYGGSVQNVYGGGYKGNMGTAENRTVNTMVEIGAEGATSFTAGNPTVLRSVYGGGEMAKIYGTSRVKMANGYVGYKYDGTDYVENLALENGKTNTLLKENGNLFGAGYGEGAVVDKSEVYLYDGKVRNGLYGGGEIAAVGEGVVAFNSTTNNYELTQNGFKRAGETHVYMYGGHVIGDVFGGGRGFSYDLTGNEVTGKVLYTDGYVFGSTDVNIYRGNVGTQENIKEGNGNVFGGGNIGYIYANPLQKQSNGHYYLIDENNTLIEDNGENILSEDCRVIVSAFTKVSANSITVNGIDYLKGEYVPTENLNALEHNNPLWNSMDDLGVTIENAVFAGGNVSAGSDKIYANATTIFGNATASVIDLYDKDLIIISNDGIGGLYGDGNLTFVDGYRELNITNYGTDYYTLNDQISITEYNNLTRREKAYYELKYRCNTQYTSAYYGGIKIDVGTSISSFEYDKLPETEQDYWETAGFCTLYAGRMMNTVQRTDFCGVFGSRMVLRGARDRVPDIVDYTNYTINRVEELSLNQVQKPGGSEKHGNYFGIFNIVNLLGAITSDVDFYSPRQSTSESHQAEGTQTYYEYKLANIGESFRNNGSSINEIALASGVYLEIVNGYDSDNKKLYGPITGVIELDLVNVKTGEGGGYVYAKNYHGAREVLTKQHVTLANANLHAVSKEHFSYTTTEATDGVDVQTSGNFVHPGKRIVDDCYPKVGDHSSEVAGQAHYWYIKGDFYVYNQYISAYTGAANSYTTTFDVPMVITPQSNGKMELKSVTPNLYAYFVGQTHLNTKTFQEFTEDHPLGRNDSIFLESNKTQYKLNEPISRWDYDHLTDQEKGYFVPETYVFITDAQFGEVTYPKGYVMVPEDYRNLPATGTDLAKKSEETKDYLVRPTNAVSNERGFILTLDFNNPEYWDDYYTNSTATQSYVKNDYNNLADQTGYIEGPTLLCEVSGIYGQKEFDKGAVVSNTVYQEQANMARNYGDELQALIDAGITQASFGQVWVAKENVEFELDDVSRHVMAGGYLSNQEYSRLSSQTLKDNFVPGKYCKNTFSPANGVYVVVGEVIASDDITETGITINGETYNGTTFKNNFEDAWICEESGKFGGTYFVAGQNYDALKYCDLDSLERRDFFRYNYDAFDALRTNFGNNLTEYSSNLVNGTAQYHLPQPVNYTAKLTGNKDISYFENPGDASPITISVGNELTRVQYEAIPNEKAKWRPIYFKKETTYKYIGEETATIGDDKQFTKGVTITEQEYDILSAQYPASCFEITKDDATLTYIVKNTLIIGDKHYTPGHTITAQEYGSLKQQEQNDFIDVVHFDAEGRYYYCVEKYNIGENGGYETEGSATINVCQNVDGEISSSQTTPITWGRPVEVGTIITGGEFKEGRRSYSVLDRFQNIANFQNGFILLGDAPIEISTLYVPRQSVILDYNQDRVVTVVYQYNYTETYDNGYNSETQEERHIINIRLHFEDGVPTIGEITPPATVLPKSTIGLRQPSVIPGAYDILGGGWEIFETAEDAKYHRNGQPYLNDATEMFWYNDGYQVEYYAKTYAGKTYSNPVTLSIANYHRLEKVMADDEFLHIDTAIVKRAPKIYVDNHEVTSTKTGVEGKSELDLLYDLYVKSITPWDRINNNFNKDKTITALKNTEIILQSDVEPIAYSANWPQLGSDGTYCFAGTIHGQGYTVNGLNKSLIDELCGDVYNLGVTGSFTSGGIADQATQKSRVENTWVSTSAGKSNATGRPVVGTGGNIVNSYYSSDEFTRTVASGDAEPRPESDFLNGSVAYDLNRYYLEKRYQDETVASGDAVYGYKYMQQDEDTLAVMYKKAQYNTQGELVTPEAYTKFYTNDYAIYLPWNHAVLEHPEKMGYIEHFYADGDYRYAQGEVRTSTDERHNRYEDGYYPIWPDDYIIFGQTLAYDTQTEHDDHPTAIKRTAKASYDITDEDQNVTIYENAYGRVNPGSNRVFRAQGYYGSSTDIKNVYFNDKLALDAKYSVNKGTENETEYNIHNGLTALDLTGKNDVKSYMDRSKDYTPILDYSGITEVRGVLDITKNLLVYAPNASGDATSMAVLKEYFNEPEMGEYFNKDGYNSTEKVSSQTVATVHGHIVAFDGQDYTAISDQYLVDGNDFNAPISYSFGKYTNGNDQEVDGYMWYQRTPGAFIMNDKTGWESISLPFTADAVTTSEKGIVTHFYEGNNIEHEYWLREFKEVEESTQNAQTTIKAVFESPKKDMDNDTPYVINNSYLNDTYYSVKDDQNGGEYQTGYDGLNRTFNNYPFYAAKKPYLIGFPGSPYYEFDMSGTFVPQNTESAISKIGKQTITFISVKDAEIGVSDDDYTSVVTPQGCNFSYTPTYQAKTLAADKTYLLNAAGTKFENGEANQTLTTVPFRAYFTPKASSAQTRGALYIGYAGDSNELDDVITERGIKVWGEHMNIYIESTLEQPVAMDIVTVAGRLIKRVTVMPGAKVTVPVNNRGVYLVGHKKVAVTK